MTTKQSGRSRLHLGPKPFSGSHEYQHKSVGIRRFSSKDYIPPKDIAEIKEPLNSQSGPNEILRVSVGKSNQPAAQPSDKRMSLENLSNFLSTDDLKVNLDSTDDTKKSSFPFKPTQERVNPQLEKLADFLKNDGHASTHAMDLEEHGKDTDDELDDVLLELEKTTNEMTKDIRDLHRLSLERDRLITENSGLSKLNHSNKSAFSEYDSSKLGVTDKNRHYLKPIASLVEKPSDADFVTPPLPPPPSDEDLHYLQNNAPSSVMTTSNLWNSQSSQDSSLISSKFKATSSYSVWTPSNNKPAKSNGVKVNSPAPKLWVPPGKATISTGYRSVALPTTKKPANSSSKGVSSTSERITLPVDQLPSASENVRVTTKDKLPDGAVYETQTIDGDVIHTDTYYPAPGGERMVLERTKTTTIVKAPHHEGMGPTDDKGVPVALRTTVGNPKAWYKNMFKQIHQLETDEDNIAEEKKEDEHRHLENKVSYQSNDNRPRRVGKITEYTPSEPYVVENEPQTQNKIPAASTSMTHKQDINKLNYKRSEPQQSPVASTDNTSKSSYIMADYVKTEPKKTTAAATQSKPRVKSQEMRKAAKVKFDFVGSSEKQLTIMKNQTVVVTRQVNNDWYEGESADGKRTGIFPVAYVEILSESPQKPVRSGSAKAKFNFKGKDPKQLTVKKGDTVELLEKVDKNWYKGRMGPVTGIIPANYLEVIREPEQTQKTASRSEPESIQKPSNNLNVVHKKSLSSSSDGSSEPDEKERMTKASFLAQAAVSSAGSHLSAPKLRRGEFDIPELEDEAMGIASPKSSILHTPQGSTDTALSDMSSSVHSHAGESSSSHAFGKDTKDNENSSQAEQSDESVPFQTQRHVALYPFAPQNEDELELLAGDVVHVVEKCDDGWYVGTCERTNAFGTFPGNYVIAAD